MSAPSIRIVAVSFANHVFQIVAAGLLMLTWNRDLSAQEAHQTLLTFRAMGDVPYSETEYQDLTRHIADLQPSAAFAIHVGDIKGGSAPCEEAVYDRVAGILRDSQPPLFMIPGDNEWNDCQNVSPDVAWGFWQNHFQRFDENWSHDLAVTRQPERDENFAFVENNVLVMGINLVGGRVHDSNEWQQRMTDDANWIRAHFETLNDEVSHAVVFAHAFAEGDRQPFADEFVSAAAAFGHPILYLQGDTHSFVQDHPFRNTSNVTRVVVDSGGAPPVQVSVTDDPTNPFLVDRNPFVPLVVDGRGFTYHQDFDLLGGLRTNLPAGWKVTKDDGPTTLITGGVVTSRIRTAVYNAGHPRASDRALATGNTASDQPNSIELYAEVHHADIKAWRLAFDVEVWGGDPEISDNPGEAVFEVTLEINTGDGFMPIKQFGKIGTGAHLIPPAMAGLLDGNDSAYRVSYDSGVQEIIIPAGSQVRLRWDAQNQGETAGWVFGLDNVVFRAVPEPSTLGMALLAAIGVLSKSRRSSYLARNMKISSASQDEK